MSKRTGKAITLTDLLEEVPIDAARFFFNMREPNSTLDFDLDLAVEAVQPEPGLLCSVRPRPDLLSILKNLAAEGISPRRSLHAEELDLLTATGGKGADPQAGYPARGDHRRCQEL